MASVDIRSLPVIGEHEFFVICEDERHRARVQAQSETDDYIRLEARMMVTHLYQWKLDDVSGLMDEIGQMSSYDPRRQRVQTG